MLELANTFHRSLDRLTAQEQAAAKQVAYDYMIDPTRPGLSLHRLDRGRDKRFWTIRVNRDVRIVVFKEGARSIFCYVGHHDDANDWGEKRRLEIHSVTGAAQIVEVAEVVQEKIRVVTREVEPPLFAHEDSTYLLSLGVPESFLPLVRKVDHDGLIELIDHLPEEAAEALCALATGERPGARPEMRVSAQLDLQMSASAAADVESREIDPFSHPDAQRRFWIAANEDDLRKALDQPWDEWLVFLHPSQRGAVERNFNGPARVSGAAGTGKSVVAMHRAALLARLSTGGRVLLTTFSKILGRRLADGMDKLLGTAGEVRGRVHVAHLHAFAMETVGRKRKEVRIAGNEDVSTALRVARGDLDNGVTNDFLTAEWEAIIDFWGIKDGETYRTIVRTGRGAALSPARRKRLWDVFAGAQAELVRKGMMTWGDLCDEARTIIEVDARPFRHVVVDEAQDFGPRELKLIAALAPPGPRSLFFAGDTGQRIYRWPFSWLSAGVDVRGRAQRLRVNYRTSEQVRRFSDSILPDTIEEIDGESETRRTLSLLRGPEPEIIGGNEAEDEISALGRWLAGLREQGVEAGQIAIFARTRRVLDQRAKAALDSAGLKGGWIGGNDDPPDDRVALGTLHAAKGLEFRAVALVGCSADQLPLPAALGVADEDARTTIIERERQLLYVGCTRAREWLLITYSGHPSRFLLGPDSG